jgi:hypothetical protein
MCRVGWIVGALFTAVLGCTEVSSPPDDFVLPPENLSLDTVALQVGDILYECGHWSPDFKRTGARIVVDLHFASSGPDEPVDRPRQASLDAVRAHGGEVLSTFAFPAARVRMTPAELAAIIGAGSADYARSVPDLARYDWPVTVRYERPTVSADWALFEALGGRIADRWASASKITGDLPNRSIPQLRASPDVESVDVPGFGFCGWTYRTGALRPIGQ